MAFSQPQQNNSTAPVRAPWVQKMIDDGKMLNPDIQYTPQDIKVIQQNAAGKIPDAPKKSTEPQANRAPWVQKMIDDGKMLDPSKKYSDHEIKMIQQGKLKTNTVNQDVQSNQNTQKPIGSFDTLKNTLGDAIKNQKPQQALKDILTGVNTGIATVGRGIERFQYGLVGADAPQDSFFRQDVVSGQQYKKNRQDQGAGGLVSAGELVGEIGPTLAIPGALPIKGLKAVQSSAPWFSKLLGVAKEGTAIAPVAAAQSALISAGQEKTAEEIKSDATTGALIGAAFPAVAAPLNALAKKAYQTVANKFAPKIKHFDDAGNPTPEFKAVMEKTGITEDEITNAVKQKIQQETGKNPEDLLREADFESVGIKPSQGELTQDYSAKKRQAQLVETAGESGAPAREHLIEASKTLRQRGDELIAELGVPEQLAPQLRSVIGSAEAKGIKKKSDFYKELAEYSGANAAIPVIKNEIVAAIPDSRMFRKMESLAPGQVKAFKELLDEFQLSSKESIAKFKKSGGEVQDLSLGNIEELRQYINQIERSSPLGNKAIFNLTGPVKKALDKEYEVLSNSLKDAGIEGNIVELAKQARLATREQKVTFHPKNIVKKLIAKHEGSDVPILADEKIFNQLLNTNKGNKTYSNLKRVIDVARKEGTEGNKAIGNLQAQTVLELMNKAFDGTSSSINGQKIFNAGAYNKALEGFGEKELKLLFKNRPEALNKLKAIGRVGTNITPSRFEAVKGSGNVLLDAGNIIAGVSTAGIFPLIKIGLKETFKSAKISKSQREILKAKARKYKKEIQEFENRYPGFAKASGISSILNEDDENGQ